LNSTVFHGSSTEGTEITDFQFLLSVSLRALREKMLFHLLLKSAGFSHLGAVFSRYNIHSQHLGKDPMDIEFSGYHHRAAYFHAVFIAYRPTFRMFINRAFFAVALASLYLAYQLNLAPDRTLPFLAPSRLLWHIVALLIFLLLIAEPYLAPVYVAMRLWRDPSVHVEWKGRVSTRGITFSASGRNILWESFREMILEPDGIILKTGAAGFISLPRDFFHSDSDWRRFCKLAETKVHPNPIPGKAPGLRK
jgi:hypothetical protein